MSISIIFKLIVLIVLTVFIYFKYTDNQVSQKHLQTIISKLNFTKKSRYSLITDELDMPQHPLAFLREIMDSLQETKEKKTKISDKKLEFEYIQDNLQGLILSHASWHYSKDFLIDGFSYLKPKNDQTVIIIGPSHNVNGQACSLSNFDEYVLPFANLEVDNELKTKMKQQMVFQQISEQEEQEEHSIELILPVLQQVYADLGKKVKIMPMYCNINNSKTRQYYGQKLREYFNDPNYFFIVTSDFTHWGPMYQNNVLEPNFTSPNGQVSAYDDMAMSEISFQDPVYFSKFIKKYNEKLQICGATGIDILLNAIYYSPEKQYKTVFTKYNQSYLIKDPQQENTFGLATGVIFEKKPSNFNLN